MIGLDFDIAWIELTERSGNSVLLKGHFVLLYNWVASRLDPPEWYRVCMVVYANRDLIGVELGSIYCLDHLCINAVSSHLLCRRIPWRYLPLSFILETSFRNTRSWRFMWCSSLVLFHKLMSLSIILIKHLNPWPWSKLWCLHCVTFIVSWFEFASITRAGGPGRSEKHDFEKRQSSYRGGSSNHVASVASFGWSIGGPRG